MEENLLEEEAPAIEDSSNNNNNATANNSDTSSTRQDEEQVQYVIPSFLDILLDSDVRILHQPPPLQIGESQEDRDYVDHLIKTAWDPAHSRALLNQYKDDSITHKELTYGEITSTGVRQLMEDMSLLKTDTMASFGKEAVGGEEQVIFYDLGSGEGKLAVQILLETLTTCNDRVQLQKIVGVELSPARHEMAVDSWNKLQEIFFPKDTKNVPYREDEGENLYTKERAKLLTKLHAISSEQPPKSLITSKLEFVHSNLLEYDYSDATHVFASSIFFPVNVLEEMSHQLHRNASQFGKLKVVAALSDLEVLEQGAPCMWEKHTQRLQMSWGGANVRLYTWKDY